jgi:hypothetical protein
MSLILAIPVSMIFMYGGLKLNIPSSHLLIVMAIIVAGGLAGCND